MRRSLLLPTLLLSLGCYPSTADNSPADKQTPGTHTGEAQTKEEKAVQAQIEMNRSSPAIETVSEIEWVKWGPNDLTGATRNDGPNSKTVRVCYICKREGRPKKMEDRLYVIGLSEGTPVTDVWAEMLNPDGDDWYGRAIAKRKQEEKDAMGTHGR